MTGIYSITNKINGKQYIGQSINIEERWRSHKSFSRKGCPLLYAAFDKYGLDNFSFEVVQECPPEDLNILEAEYIKRTGALFDGYNLTVGGENGVRGENNGNSKLTWESVHDIIDLLSSNQFSCQEIADLFYIDSSVIRDINNGISWVLPNTNYPIMDLALLFAAKKSYVNNPNHSFKNPETFVASHAAIQRKYGVSSVLVLDEFKEKARETKLERYGDANYNNREKAKQTFLTKTGYDNPMKDPEVKARAQETMLNKYGSGRKEIVQKGHVAKVKNGSMKLFVNIDTGMVGTSTQLAAQYCTRAANISRAVKDEFRNGRAAGYSWRHATEEERDKWIQNQN